MLIITGHRKLLPVWGESQRENIVVILTRLETLAGLDIPYLELVVGGPRDQPRSVFHKDGSTNPTLMPFEFTNLFPIIRAIQFPSIQIPQNRNLVIVHTHETFSIRMKGNSQDVIGMLVCHQLLSRRQIKSNHHITPCSH